jgi:hypothetical protein
MTRGRPPLGPEIVEHLQGSPEAKHRMRVILQTLAGDLSVPQACAELDISESRFHEMRGELLQQALEQLEAKPRGRPPDIPSEQEARIRQLQQQVQSLTADLRAGQIREELAIMLPRLAHPPQPAPDAGKKGGRRRRRR